MPATMEQTKIDQLPTVTVDEDDTVFNVPVIISRGDVPGQYHHEVSAISAAGPTGSRWTVKWTLMPIPSLTATFDEPGIKVPKDGTRMPEGVDFIPPQKVSPTEWQFTFTNNVADVNVIRYDLAFGVQDGGTPLTRANVRFDPTIAVVKEPVDPGAG